MEEEKKESEQLFNSILDASNNQNANDMLTSGAAMMLAADPRLGQSTVEMHIVPDVSGPQSANKETILANAVFTTGEEE